MSAFFSRAEEILQVATSGSGATGSTLMILNRQGGIRMIDATGWNLPASLVEFGAEAVYKVERRGASIRVEGWNGSERCLLQGQTSGERARALIGAGFSAHATMLQVTSGAAA